MKLLDKIKKAFSEARQGMNPSMGMQIEGEMIIRDKDGNIKEKRKIKKRNVFN